MIYCTHVTFTHNWEGISPKYHRSRIKNQTGLLYGSKVSLSEVGEVIRMATDVPDPLRQGLGGRHVVPIVHTGVPGLWLPLFFFCGSRGCTSLLGPLPHLSSFAFQPVCLLLPSLLSHGTEVSQKMELRPLMILHCYEYFVYTSTKTCM